MDENDPYGWYLENNDEVANANEAQWWRDQEIYERSIVPEKPPELGPLCDASHMPHPQKRDRDSMDNQLLQQSQPMVTPQQQQQQQQQQQHQQHQQHQQAQQHMLQSGSANSTGDNAGGLAGSLPSKFVHDLMVPSPSTSMNMFHDWGFASNSAVPNTSIASKQHSRSNDSATNANPGNSTTTGNNGSTGLTPFITVNQTPLGNRFFNFNEINDDKDSDKS